MHFTRAKMLRNTYNPENIFRKNMSGKNIRKRQRFVEKYPSMQKVLNLL